MKVAMDVWFASEVPHHVRAFDLPCIPYLIGSDIVLASVPRDVKTIDDMLLLDRLDRGLNVLLAKHSHHALHRTDQEFLLICTQLRARKPTGFGWGFDDSFGSFATRLASNQTCRLLLPRQ